MNFFIRLFTRQSDFKDIVTRENDMAMMTMTTINSTRVNPGGCVPAFFFVISKVLCISSFLNMNNLFRRLVVGVCNAGRCIGRRFADHGSQGFSPVICR